MKEYEGIKKEMKEDTKDIFAFEHNSPASSPAMSPAADVPAVLSEKIPEEKIDKEQPVPLKQSSSINSPKANV